MKKTDCNYSLSFDCRSIVYFFNSKKDAEEFKKLIDEIESQDHDAFATDDDLIEFAKEKGVVWSKKFSPRQDALEAFYKEGLDLMIFNEEDWEDGTVECHIKDDRLFESNMMEFMTTNQDMEDHCIAIDAYKRMVTHKNIYQHSKF